MFLHNFCCIRQQIGKPASRSFALSIQLLFYFVYAVTKWGKVFECYLLTSLISLSCCNISLCSSIYYLLQYPSQVCIRHYDHIDLNLILQSYFFCLLCCIFHVHHYSSRPSLSFWTSIIDYLAIYIYSYNNQSSSIICCFFFDGLYFSFGISIGVDLLSVCADVGLLPGPYEAIHVILSACNFV